MFQKTFTTSNWRREKAPVKSKSGGALYPAGYKIENEDESQENKKSLSGNPLYPAGTIE